MYIFEKTQNLIDPTDVISRQHAIPSDVKKYAVTWQLSFPNPAGRGRGNVPSLADIYEQLILNGLNIVERGANVTVGTKPVFTEIGLPNGSTQTRIKLNTATDKRLRELKSRIDGGEFEIVSGPAYRRRVTQISLISLSVNLMQIAIACENVLIDQPKQRRGVLSPV
jgi:hypothetical protein